MTNFFKQFINSKGEKLNEGEATEGHFFTPNGYKGRRLKDTNLTNVNAVFADWDFKPAEGATTGSAKPDYKQFRLDLDGLPEPTYVIESGNGWHLYWMLEESVEVDDDNRAEMILLVEGIQRHIHKTYGSDGGAIDALRLMRYPGYEHKKQPEHPFMVTVVEETDSRYTLDELKELLPPVLKEAVDVAEPSETEHFDIRKVVVDVWASKGQVVSFDPTGRLLWGEEKTATGTFIGRHGSCNYIATTSDDYPYKGNPTTYVAGVMGVTNKQAYGWLCDTYGKPVREVAVATVVEGTGAPLPEKLEYQEWMEQMDWDVAKDIAKLRRLREVYSLVVHRLFAQQHPHLLYELGEEKVYWDYDETTGCYEELSVSTVKVWLSKLLMVEEMSDKATDAFIRNCLLRLRGEYQERAKTLDSFDTDDRWFHANNGWVNLVTLEFTPHTPERLSLRCSAVDYEPDAVCPRYDKFLNSDVDLKADAVRVIDQFSGLSLTRDMRYQKMLTLIGKPGSGKSTLLEVWAHTLGDLCTQKRLTDLSGESYRFAGSSMTGKSLCWFDEVEVKKAEMSNVLGTLITGTSINVERKGINGIYKADNGLKCVLTANDLPRTSEHGMYRRMIYIEFNHSFYDDGTQETNILEVLKSEASGILNRMIRGLHDLRKMRGFTMIEGHEDAIEEYKASSDTMAEFLDTYFEPSLDPADAVTTTVMLNTYKEFTGDRSYMILTPQRFGRMVRTQPLAKFNNIEAKQVFGKGRCWTGLRVREGYKLNTTAEIIQLVESGF